MTETMLRTRTTGHLGFAGVFRAELMKALRGRAIVLLAWFAIVLSGVTAYGYASIGAETGQDPAVVVDDIVRAWMMVLLFSGVFCAMYTAREFDSRVINRTVLLAGTRQRVLAAKLGVTAVVGTCFGVLAALGAGVSAIVFPLTMGEQPAWSAEATLTVIGVIACCILSALWGAGLGLAVRHQLAAILIVVGVTLLIDPGAQRIWPEASNGLFTIALSSIYLDPKPELLAVPLATLIALAWVAAAIGAGCWRFLRRDLP